MILSRKDKNWVFGVGYNGSYNRVLFSSLWKSRKKYQDHFYITVAHFCIKWHLLKNVLNERNAFLPHASDSISYLSVRRSPWNFFIILERKCFLQTFKVFLQCFCLCPLVRYSFVRGAGGLGNSKFSSSRSSLKI